MFRTLLMIVLSAAQASAVEAKGPRSSRGDGLSFQVRMQDYADIPRGVRKVATATASRVFRRAGVAIDWLSCSPDSPKRDDGCAAEMPAGARILRILPPDMAARVAAGAKIPISPE